jgi:hypothetical protein
MVLICLFLPCYSVVMATEAQQTANRANSQLSTGPKTAEGKAKVSHNAIKHALTGATVLLPADDAALYRQQLDNAHKKWQPVGDDEALLVQSLVDTQWRLRRIPALISGIYALGRLQHAEMFADQPEDLRASLLETHIFQTSRRDLNNLALQEHRLRSHLEKDIEQLKALQAERKQRERRRIFAAMSLYLDLKRQKKPFNPAEFGFEFSLDEIEYQLAYDEGERRSGYPEQYAKMRARELRKERIAA